MQVLRYEKDEILDIKGFCSAQVSKEMALDAAFQPSDFEDQENEQLMLLVDKEGSLQSVLFQISFTEVWAHFEMNSSIYSSFPEE